MTDEKKRVLLVDDEPQVLAGLRVHLRKRYDVFIAEGGAEGLEYLRESGPFAVIIADMRMPGMNGVEFLRKARKKAPDAVRILLTGYTDVDSAIGAVNEGRIFRFLTKPCPPPELMGAVAEAVEKHDEICAEKAYVRGEKHRVSEKIVKASRMAALGSIAGGAGRKLSHLAQAHNAVLDDVIAHAATGGFVSVEALEELRDIERYLARTASSLKEYASADQHSRPVDLREVVEKAVELAKMTVEGDEVTVETDFRAGVPPVIASSAHIEQVLLSLIANAVEAVRKTDRESRITVRVRHDRMTDEVVCEVEDNGCGIHAEARPFLFRPFFSTKGERGTGLGLSVARKLLESWKGRLTFDSTYRSGSIFRAHMPSAAEHEATTTNNRDGVAAPVRTA